ncbi:MAG: alpha/beta fold hydrolase [Sinobacteraceae bacterium]|nr:alpha/beta fold hydrolase [Nevskiaceae bacterium]MCP5470714.1 alpha/beta fold hydrolase [Nevskiaceae bacterium]
MAHIAESVVLLGPRRSLVGIHTHPAGDSSGREDICVVIINAGIIHRVGPNRLHVELARALSAAGLSAVRLDLSGIGDSDSRADSLNPLDGALADIREALDTLVESGKVKRFILLGLCSGANHAAIRAADDERIIAIGLVDPFIPRTRRYYLNHYFRRMTRVGSWKNFFRGDHPAWQWLEAQLLRRRTDRTLEQGGPDPAEVRRYLARIYDDVVRRGVRIFAAFTGDLESQHNYREQLLDAFPDVAFGTLLDLYYFGDVDHTFSSSNDRTALISLILKWASKL